MAAFGARFRRGASTNTRGGGDERVGEILSDSSDDGGSPIGASVSANRLQEAATPAARKPRRATDRSLRSSASSDGREDGASVAPRSGAVRGSSSASDRSVEKVKQKEEQETTKTRMKKTTQKKTKPSALEMASRNRSSRATSSTKRSVGRKWYSDSEEEEQQEASAAGPPGKRKTKVDKPKKAVESEEEDDSDLDAYISGAMMGPTASGSGASDRVVASPKQSRPKLKRLGDRGEKSGGDDGNRSDASASGILSPLSESEGSRGAKKGKSNLLKLMAKTRALSPFGGKSARGFGANATDPPVVNTPVAPTTSSASVSDDVKKTSSGSLEGKAKAEEAGPDRVGATTRGNNAALTSEQQPPSKAPDTQQAAAADASRPIETATGGGAPTIIVNRRTDRLKHSASGSDYSGSPRRALESNDDVLSPGPRKVPGAFPGKAGSGVLLEGWLRQKQRRGVKGLKKWNARYFVLYARRNEVRYYADVVQSAWGPIPLGEIGAISLRLIQRIGKRSHPKYKGCRFDITCRNSWGTHYADDYVSSDEENGNSSNNINPSTNEEAATASAGAAAKPQQEKSGTPQSSRVYSLIADSPQVTVAWVNMLDSLLVRSANSPRPDVSSPAESSGTTSATSAKAKKSRTVARQRASALDTESAVLLGTGEHVPKAVVYAINFIFDSTPGIETERFYELEPEASKLRVRDAALKFLNQFAGESSTHKPSKDELEAVLDAVTAGAVVRLWLKQLEQSIVPFAMYEDFRSLAREAQTAPFDLRRNLRSLLEALPKKNLYVFPLSSGCLISSSNVRAPLVYCSTMLACLLFHLNDVNGYKDKNGMDAARLAHHFAEFVLRPQTQSIRASDANVDASAVRSLVEEMITNADAFIDEKEAQLLEDHRL
ncbi:hypothetical protein BBJ28_00023952 [Nothophytophthora sp. Chile5]|nr:hypothetical protein BBJ28_00023952 [Nothophytophthora sp. Chile5]